MRPSVLLRSALLSLPLLALAAPAAAQDGWGEGPGWSPDPRAEAPPPAARVVLGVESHATTASAAFAANDLARARVQSALAQLSIPGTIVRAGEPFVEPEYEAVGPISPRAGLWASEPRIVGYRVLTPIVVRTRSADRIGLIIDMAVGAGANRVLEGDVGRGRGGR